MNIENIIEGYLNENDEKSKQPDKIKLELKEHQLTLLKRIEDIENQKDKVCEGYNKGVIADTVGSGKSIVILSAIQNNINYKANDSSKFSKELCNNWWGTTIKYENVNLIKSNLIVVPHSIFNQWVGYINNYTQLSLYQISRQSQILPKEERYNYSNYDIVLCKSTQYNNLMETFEFEEEEKTNDKFIEFYEKYNVYQTINEISKIQNEIFDLPRYELCKTRPRSAPTHIVPYLNKINDINSQFYKNTKKLNDLLTSFDYKKFIDEYNELCREIKDIRVHKGDIWCRVIFDEADSIGISNCLDSRAYFTWFITSSIKNLIYPNGFEENNISVSGLHHNGYIKNVFRRIYFLNRFAENLKYIFIKNQDSYVDNSFLNSFSNMYKHFIKCDTPKEILVLNGMLDDNIMQMINAGNTNKAIELLGCNVVKENNMIRLYTKNSYNKIDQLKERIKDLETEVSWYYKFLESNFDTFLEFKDKKLSGLKNIFYSDNKYEILDSIEKDGYKDDILERIDILKKDIILIKNNYAKLELNISNIKYRIKLLDDSNCKKLCPICFDEIEKPVNMKCCQNLICFSCIMKSLNISKNCPFCRKKVKNTNDFLVIDDKNENVQIEDESCNSKSNIIETIIKDMNQIEDFRLLIFSEHDNSFDSIYDFLNQNNLKYGKLVGNSDCVQGIINDYISGKIKILILNAKNYGSGINLEVTTHIIFYHRMNEELEKQVIGRGYRFGRKKDLNIMYLLHENEPEVEKSMSYQDIKKDIIVI